MTQATANPTHARENPIHSMVHPLEFPSDGEPLKTYPHRWGEDEQRRPHVNQIHDREEEWHYDEDEPRDREDVRCNGEEKMKGGEQRR